MDIFTRQQAKVHKSYLTSPSLFVPKNTYIRQEKYEKLLVFSAKQQKKRNTGFLRFCGAI